MTVEGEHSFAEVVEPGMGGAGLRCRPIESVGIQARVLAVKTAPAAEQGVESGAASGVERFIVALPA